MGTEQQQRTEKPEVTDEHKKKAKEMARAYDETRPTSTLPGSGGTVAVLGRRDAGAAVAEVARTFAEKTGHEPCIFSGSSPGSAAFGHLILRRT